MMTEAMVQRANAETDPMTRSPLTPKESVKWDQVTAQTHRNMSGHDPYK